MPIFSITDPVFWLQFLYYGIVVFFVYYIPGSFFIQKILLPRVFHVALAITIGIALFALQGFVFGYLDMRFMTYVYIAVCSVVYFISVRKKIRIIGSGRYSISWKAITIIVVGSFMQLSTIWFTGLVNKGAAYYCCGNANDNFLYGTLSREVIRSIPPEHPGISGELFENYHYWSNIVIGETSRISGLPVFQLQFQYSTVLMAVVTGLLLLGLVWELGGSAGLGLWVLFFFYFGSDAIYWIIFFLRSAPAFAMSSLEDGVGFLANYPRAMAVMVSLAAITMLFRTRKKSSVLLMAITALLFASAAGMKIYVAFFIYTGLLCLALYDLLRYRSRTSVIIGVLTLALVLPIYLLTNAGAGGLYYLGFWRAQNFIVQPWLNLLRLEQARIIFEADHKWLQVTFYNILFTAIYIVAIFGTKIIGFFNTKSSYGQIPLAAHVFFIPSLVISFLLGFFYNQDTGESNTFNFLVSVFIYASIYAALVMNHITVGRRKIIGLIAAFVIIVFTLPRPVYHYFRNISDLVNMKSFYVSKNILDSAAYVRRATDPKSVFLVNSQYFKFDTEGPVFSMLMDRPMYYSGEQFITWFKAPPEEVFKRKTMVSTIFTSASIIEVAAAIAGTPIAYIIDIPGTSYGATTSASFLRATYANFDIRILKVIPEAIPDTVFEDFAESTTASKLRLKELRAQYL